MTERKQSQPAPAGIGDPAEPRWPYAILWVVTPVSIGVLLATGNDPLLALLVILPLGLAIMFAIEIRDIHRRKRFRRDY